MPSPCLPVAAVVLAAGTASRMGRLKQLLPYRGGTFVQHAVRQALEARFDPVIVVVGAGAEAVQAAIAPEPVHVVHNEGWQRGMGSSVSAGVRRIQEEGFASAAVAITLADQPLVTGEHLRAMRQEIYLSGAAVVAAEYNGMLGVPAIFARKLMGELINLPPEAGARHLLRRPELQVKAFPLPEAAMDIDTPEDLQILLTGSAASS
jgi:molybdenum cofactor cytidylyltransferase